MNFFKKNFDKPKSEHKTETQESNLMTRLGKIKGVKELAASLTLFAVSSSEVHGENVDTLSGVDDTEEVVSSENNKDIGRSLETKNNHDSSIDVQGDIYDRFLIKDDNGELKFNPWSLLSPVQVEAGYDVENKNIAKFNIPFEYSRLFDSADELSDSDKVAIKEYIDNQLKHELEQTLIFLDVSDNTKDVYKTEHGIDSTDLRSNNIVIDSIKITGTASPEGLDSKGASSLDSGYVDQENLDLASKRAEKIEPWLLESLKELGVDEDVITKIDAKEIQFTNEEYSALSNIVQKVGLDLANDREAVFRLVQMYNDNKFVDNPEIQKQLNEIIGNKRSVEVTIYTHGKESKKVVIPLPVLLLLLAAVPLLLKKRRENAVADNGVENVPDNASREVFTDEVIDFSRDLSENDANFVSLYHDTDDFVMNGGVELQEKEEMTYIDDIDRYYDDEVTINRGLDYHKMIIEISQIADRYDNEADLELAVSHILLTRWKEHDQRARQEVDITSEEGLDYHTNKDQVIWARLHAKELIKLADIYRQDPNNLDKVRAQRRAELIKRKDNRESL